MFRRSPKSNRALVWPIRAAAFAASLWVPVAAHAQLVSGTWTGATTTEWTDDPNWSGAVAPNDIATFTNNAAPTTLTISGGGAQLNTIQFSSTAPAYTIHLLPAEGPTLRLSGSGILNNSAQPQTFSIDGGRIFFANSSSAGNAIINNVGGNVEFDDASTAGTAVITTGAGALTSFFNAGTTSQAQLIALAGGAVDFSGVAQTTPRTIAVGSIEGAGSIHLGASIVTVGGNNRSTTFSGVIDNCGTSGTQCSAGSGTLGSIVKVGAGTLILNGVNAYTGTTTINGGAVTIGDASHLTASIAGGAIVNVNGTLLGHGTIGGAVTNGGTVQPGGSIGILSVTGNYTQSAAGNLVIEITPNAAAGPGIGYSQLRVTGKAGLAGMLTINNDPGTYAVGTKYTIVAAAGGVTGTFATQIYTPGFATFIVPVVTYDANDAFLTLTAAAVITPAGVVIPLLSDGQQVADMLTSIATGVDAMDDAVLDDVCDTRQRVAAEPGRGCERRLLANGMSSEVWVRAFGGLGGLGGSGSRVSFNNSFAGTLVGYGIRSDRITVGGGVGYLASMLDLSDGSHASQNAGLGFLYARYQSGPVWLGAMASYGGGRVNGQRVLSGTGLTASGGRGSDFGSADLRGVYTAEVGAFTVQPRVGVSYIHVGQDGFADRGAGLLDLQYGATNADILQGHVAVRVMRQTHIGSWNVAPWVEVGARSMFSGLRRTVAVSAGNIAAVDSGVSPAPMAGTAAVGVEIAVSDQLHGFVRYQGLYSANQIETVLSAGARYEF
jgi:autotransporter-associated beta strand protein